MSGSRLSSRLSSQLLHSSGCTSCTPPQAQAARLKRALARKAKKAAVQEVQAAPGDLEEQRRRADLAAQQLLQELEREGGQGPARGAQAQPKGGKGTKAKKKGGWPGDNRVGLA